MEDFWEGFNGVFNMGVLGVLSGFIAFFGILFLLAFGVDLILGLG